MENMKLHLLGFRASLEEVSMADALAKRLRCSRSEALRRMLWAASGTHQPHPVVNLEKTNRHDAKEFSGQSITAVSA